MYLWMSMMMGKMKLWRKVVMIKNDIIEEVWRNRDEFAKQHNYNLNEMVTELQKMKQNPFSHLVDRRKIAPNNSIHSHFSEE